MEPDFETELPPDLARLGSLRRALADWLTRADVEASAREAVVLAAHEAAANAVQHADSAVIVTGFRDGDGVTVVVRNAGPWREAQRSEFRGRGLPLMHGLMSSVEVASDDGGSVVQLRLTL
jgi:anti-sigma regulatory factor (Ser/Thr protein kinase)